MTRPPHPLGHILADSVAAARREDLILATEIIQLVLSLGDYDPDDIIIRVGGLMGGIDARELRAFYLWLVLDVAEEGETLVVRLPDPNVDLSTPAARLAAVQAALSEGKKPVR